MLEAVLAGEGGKVALVFNFSYGAFASFRGIRGHLYFSSGTERTLK
jgi:hypothetical protein